MGDSGGLSGGSESPGGGKRPEGRGGGKDKEDEGKKKNSDGEREREREAWRNKILLQHHIAEDTGREQAPYTGPYYRYITEKDVRIEKRKAKAKSDSNEPEAVMSQSCLGKLLWCSSCCCRMCCSKKPQMLLEEEVKDEGWKEETRGAGSGHRTRIKPWKGTFKTMDGISRIGGEPKRTYEVVLDYGENTYHMERLEDYRMAVMVMRGFIKMYDSGGALQQYISNKDTNFPSNLPEFKKDKLNINDARAELAAKEARLREEDDLENARLGTQLLGGRPIEGESSSEGETDDSDDTDDSSYETDTDAENSDDDLDSVDKINYQDDVGEGGGGL